MIFKKFSYNLKIILIFSNLFLSSICAVQAQKEETKSDLGLIFSPGITFQGNSFLDLNLLLRHVNVEESPKLPPLLTYNGLRIGVESNFRFDENYAIAPKIGYEYNFMLVTVRASVVNYFQNNKSELRLLPEIGFSFLTLFDLTYGYGIPLSNENLNNVSKHRLTIRINLNKKLNGMFFYSDLN